MIISYVTVSYRILLANIIILLTLKVARASSSFALVKRVEVLFTWSGAVRRGSGKMEH